MPCYSARQLTRRTIQRNADCTIVSLSGGRPVPMRRFEQLLTHLFKVQINHLIGATPFELVLLTPSRSYTPSIAHHYLQRTINTPLDHKLKARLPYQMAVMIEESDRKLTAVQRGYKDYHGQGAFPKPHLEPRQWI